MSRPVFARHAASVLLWRGQGDGLEVLMGLRGAGHRFMPNRLVFPGGAVEPGDKRAPAAAEPDEATMAQLGLAAAPPLARGLAMAAARELEEETGLSFGQPPRLDALRYLCRAVTPPGMPMRFNARFLFAPAEAANGTIAGSGELESVGFQRASAVLDSGLHPVTRAVLVRLGERLSRPDEVPAMFFAYKRQRWTVDRRLDAKA